MNTETKHKLLRVLGWDKKRGMYVSFWEKNHLTVTGTDQALAHAETMKAALEFMERSDYWRYIPKEKHWCEVDAHDGYEDVVVGGDTQQEAVLAGMVAWCELNDGWPE